jgi:hypothetical protein
MKREEVLPAACHYTRKVQHILFFVLCWRYQHTVAYIIPVVPTDEQRNIFLPDFTFSGDGDSRCALCYKPGREADRSPSSSAEVKNTWTLGRQGSMG